MSLQLFVLGNRKMTFYDFFFYISLCFAHKFSCAVPNDMAFLSPTDPLFSPNSYSNFFPWGTLNQFLQGPVLSKVVFS